MSINNNNLLNDSDKTISDSSKDDDNIINNSISTCLLPIKETIKIPIINQVQLAKIQKASSKCRGRWTIIEQKQFLKCLLIHKTDWNTYCNEIKTRSLKEIRIHLKHFISIYKKKNYSASEVKHMIKTHGAKYGFDFNDEDYAVLYNFIFKNEEVGKLYQKRNTLIFNITKEPRRNKNDSYLQKKTSCESNNAIALNGHSDIIRIDDLYLTFHHMNNPKYDDYDQSTI